MIFFNKLFSFFKKKEPAVSPNPELKSETNIKRCLELYRGLPTHKKFPNDLRIMRLFNLLFKNVNSYIRVLEQFKILVSDSVPISRELINFDTIEVSVEKFFTSDDNFYLDENKALNQLRKSAIELCLALLSEKPEHSITLNHNRMLTMILIENLIYLGNTFCTMLNQNHRLK